MSARRVDRVIALAGKVTEARAELARLEAELGALLAGGERTKVARAKPQRSTLAPTPAKVEVSEPKIPNGHRERGGKFCPEYDRIVELIVQGLTPSEVAAKLGLEGRPGRIKVSNVVYRAKKAGRFPKGQRS